MSNLKFWYLYLIECIDGSIYIGIIIDVEVCYVVYKNGSGVCYICLYFLVKLLGFEVYVDWLVVL